MVSGQIASLSLLKLSLGMLNIGQSGSAEGRAAFLFVVVEEEERSPGGSVSDGAPGPGSGGGASPLIFPLRRPQPRGPLPRAGRTLAGGFSDVSDKVVSSELTLFVDLLTFSIEPELAGLPLPVLVRPFS